MRWLLLYTHAYEKALNITTRYKMIKLYGLSEDLYCEYDKSIKYYESVLTFIEKRIKLIKYDN